jgi:Cytochrome c554 and c-prime
MKKLWIAGAVPLCALVLVLPGARVYYGSTGGTACTRCHEIEPDYNAWDASSHRGIQCGECHTSSSLNNLKRLYSHARGDVPEQVHLRNSDLPAMMERCRSCHRQEFADWQSGPHSSTYARIFLDKKHNARTPLMDDCLRCHGMHFEGGVRDLVTPVNTAGPWTMLKADLQARPAIPCLACHQMHRQGPQLQKAGEDGKVAGPRQEINRPSLALYDRRTQAHVAVARLSLPVMREGERRVKMSPDQRQALCYQCHAAEASAEVGTGDDRTGVGIHEGISCLACHQKHGQQTRASCANCHPRLSNCGLDVEKMDTTFSKAESRHNIHRVKCVDCHTKGVPKKRS